MAPIMRRVAVRQGREALFQRMQNANFLYVTSASKSFLHITDEDLAGHLEGLSDVISQYATWRELLVRECEGNFCTEVASGLERNAHVKSLTFRSCRLTTGSSEALSRTLLHNKTLQVLRFSDSTIGDFDLQDLLLAVACGGNALRKLVLESTGSLLSAGVNAALSDLLGRHRTLKHFTLCCVEVGTEATLSAVASGLRQNQSGLQELVLSSGDTMEGRAGVINRKGRGRKARARARGGRGKGEEGVALLSAALALAPGLRSLQLHFREDLSAAEAQALASRMRDFAGLRRLSLAGNGLRDAGVAPLAAALSEDRHLLELDLANNGFAAKGCEALAEALRSNGHLQSLNVSANPFGPEGMRHLAGALAVNSSLRKLDAGTADILEEGAGHLAKALLVNRGLTELDLRRNILNPEGIRLLSEALVKNRRLRALSVKNNNLGALGAAHLARALTANRSLTTLNAANNILGAHGSRFLGAALARNGHLFKIVGPRRDHVDAQARRRIVYCPKDCGEALPWDELLLHEKQCPGRRLLLQACSEGGRLSIRTMAGTTLLTFPDEEAPPAVRVVLEQLAPELHVEPGQLALVGARGDLLDEEGPLRIGL